jgi:hypothetical protein
LVVVNRLLVAVAACLLATVGCSGGDDDNGVESNLSVNDLGRAVEAVRAAHPDQPVEFTEINVQTGLINLFYAQPDATELAYVWTDGKLGAPNAPQAQLEGAMPFTLDDVDFSATTRIINTLTEELSESLPAQLTLINSASGLNWTACLIGARGTTLAVGFNLAGEVLGAVPDGCTPPN